MYSCSHVAAQVRIAQLYIGVECNEDLFKSFRFVLLQKDLTLYMYVDKNGTVEEAVNEVTVTLLQWEGLREVRALGSGEGKGMGEVRALGSGEGKGMGER